MSTYQKKLKRSKNGIVRYVGRNIAGHREKFYLGWDIPGNQLPAQHP